MNGPVKSAEALAAERAAVAGQPWPKASTAWYAVFVLALSAMFAQLDLSIMALLVQPIKKDLHLSDVQISLLLGFAFAIFYTFVGLPAARFVDRKSRKTILAIGIATWSLGTVFCGLAQGFAQLFLSRVVVGAGESVNGPATYSLISDYFPKHRIQRAVSVMQIGVICGSGFSLLFGAFVIHQLSHLPPMHIAGLGVVRWWQLVFVAVGLPGLIVAALMQLTVKEPPRRGVVGLAKQERVSMREVIRFLFINRAIFGPMIVGLAIGMVASGVMMWMPAFYQRTYGWTPAQVGLFTGLAAIVSMPIGLFVGVRLGERFERQGRHEAPLRVVIIARLIGVPCSILLPLMPSPWLALAFGAVGSAVLAMGGAAQSSALQIVAPNQMRGQITALYLFFYSVIGTGIAPTIVALVTQYVFHAESQLRYAMLLTSGTMGPLALIVLWMGVKPYGREVARIHGQAQGQGEPG